MSTIRNCKAQRLRSCSQLDEILGGDESEFQTAASLGKSGFDVWSGELNVASKLGEVVVFVVVLSSCIVALARRITNL